MSRMAQTVESWEGESFSSDHAGQLPPPRRPHTRGSNECISWSQAKGAVRGERRFHFTHRSVCQSPKCECVVPHTHTHTHTHIISLSPFLFSRSHFGLDSHTLTTVQAGGIGFSWSGLFIPCGTCQHNIAVGTASLCQAFTALLPPAGSHGT